MKAQQAAALQMVSGMTLRYLRSLAAGVLLVLHVALCDLQEGGRHAH
jgi:hypothetical protein